MQVFKFCSFQLSVPFLVFIVGLNLYGQEPSAKIWLDKLEEVLKLPDGKIYGNLIIQKKQFQKKIYFEIFKKKHKSLYIFSNNRTKKILSKVYYTTSKSEAKAQLIPTSETLIRKERAFYFDRILYSHFSYADLSHYKYKESYKTKDIKTIGNQIQMTLESIEKFQYQKMIIFFNKNTSNPEEIDFYDLQKVLFKTFYFKYNLVKTQNKNKTKKVYRLKKIISQKLSTGNSSIFEVDFLDYDIKFESSIFRLD